VGMKVHPILKVHCVSVDKRLREPTDGQVEGKISPYNITTYNIINYGITSYGATSFM
jgi:hypothetical protein